MGCLQPHNEENDFVELQRGCIEFLASCLQVAALKNKMWLRQIVITLRQIVVEESNEINIEWLDTKLFKISMKREYLKSTVLKVCILNAYLLVSKNISQELICSCWANHTSIWVMKLIDEKLIVNNKGSTQNSTLLKVMLNILFVLITRT